MGKYGPSKLRAAFSEWHYKKLNPSSYAIDIDMVEARKANGTYVPIAFIEIQRFGDSLTVTELGVYEWLIKKTGLPVYVVETDERFIKFSVRNFGSPESKQYYSEQEFIEWEDGLRGYKSLNNKEEINWDKINELKRPVVHNHTQQSLSDEKQEV
ncbi:hypothetical protein KKE60_06845 [Patescibacteria group bacterium]|nr:hypothetical protein [Patescibacteria group bacterium]